MLPKYLAKLKEIRFDMSKRELLDDLGLVGGRARKDIMVLPTLDVNIVS